MTDDQQLTLWLGATRYYLGRETYAVGQDCDRAHWERVRALWGQS